jgi:hypothetical protein
MESFFLKRSKSKMKNTPFDDGVFVVGGETLFVTICDYNVPEMITLLRIKLKFW